LIFVGVQWRGVGFLLQSGRDFSDVAQVVAAMAIMVIIGILADRWCLQFCNEECKPGLAWLRAEESGLAN